MLALVTSGVSSLKSGAIAGFGSQAYASVIDRPFFNAQALVIVIAATEDEANGGIAPVAVDFALLTPSSSGSAAPDLIGADVTYTVYTP